MARLNNTFEFIGDIHLPVNKEKFHEINTYDGGWEGHKLSFSVQESKLNSVFVELYGGFFSSKLNFVKSFSKGNVTNNGSKIEIPWEDRLKQETLDIVADFKKIIVDFTSDFELKKEISKLRYEIRNLEYKESLTDSEKEKLIELKQKVIDKAPDYHEFITEYDAITCLSENLEKYKNNKFRITGKIGFQESKGVFYRKFKPELVEIVDKEEVSKLKSTMDIFFTKESLNDKDFKEDRKVYIDAHVMGYDSKAKKDVFFPQRFVINAQKIDFTNELHVKRFEYFKNKFNVKGKGVYHLPWTVNIFRGAEQVDFTIEDLSVTQREEVELGISKVESFKPKSGLLGQTREENRLVKPLLQVFDKQNNFQDGAVETSYEVEELEYVVTTPIQKKEVEIPNETVKPELDDLDDLFA